MRRILNGLGEANTTPTSGEKYLMERGDSRITDLAAYAANSKWRADSQAAGVKNSAAIKGQKIMAPDAIDRFKMQAVYRMAILKVMRENNIDLFVHPSVGVPQWKIGIDREPTINDRIAAGPSITDLLGVPEVTIPAGYSDIVYDPTYELRADKKGYTLVTGKVKSIMKTPMPFSINFWGGPGDEPTLLKAASAYEVSTKHRKAPAAFGPLK
jgi:amidase